MSPASERVFLGASWSSFLNASCGVCNSSRWMPRTSLGESPVVKLKGVVWCDQLLGIEKCGTVAPSITLWQPYPGGGGLSYIKLTYILVTGWSPSFILYKCVKLSTGLLQYIVWLKDCFMETTEWLRGLVDWLLVDWSIDATYTLGDNQSYTHGLFNRMLKGCSRINPPKLINYNNHLDKTTSFEHLGKVSFTLSNLSMLGNISHPFPSKRTTFLQN